MLEITEFQRKTADMLAGIELKMNEPLAKHTSFRIGGPAEVMAFPKTEEELVRIMKVSDLLDSEFVILGAGTNVLAPDGGRAGLTVCLKNCFGGLESVDGETIRVHAGVTMREAANFAAERGLSGLEFAHGIPGTVGGGVFMNAGAYGGEICQVCTRVAVLERTGEKKILSREEMQFSYRRSVLKDGNAIALWAEFRLTPEDPAVIRGRMAELQQKRRSSQPLDMPSAGSTFKRPVGGYAAALIDQAGLKGFGIGGAAVSQKHAGFVVNMGGATEADVLALIEHIKQKVLDTSGILLEPEVVRL